MSSLFESLFGTTTFPYMMTSILSIKITDWKWYNKNVISFFLSDVFNSNGRLENNRVLHGNQKLPEWLNCSVLSVSWWDLHWTVLYMYFDVPVSFHVFNCCQSKLYSNYFKIKQRFEHCSFTLYHSSSHW